MGTWLSHVNKPSWRIFTKVLHYFSAHLDKYGAVKCTAAYCRYMRHIQAAEHSGNSTLEDTDEYQENTNQVWSVLPGTGIQAVTPFPSTAGYVKE